MTEPHFAPGVRVLYQRYSCANRAFSYIDSGYAAGWRSLGATVCEWLDEDGQPTLAEFFAPGIEIELADSPERMINRVRSLAANEPTAAAQANSGQKRALADHTYATRAARLLAVSGAHRAAGDLILPYNEPAVAEAVSP